ncbi:hypothetical protein [Nocardioides sp. SYSU D00038]|uniref:hypothetical protein n=1 Tax=Nocardioides sp. SYSU D00038 TaxID=2812554 RepID=UPI001966F74C|nr:hypothetical protein [Nocardioides sp. SYSU D00038]
MTRTQEHKSLKTAADQATKARETAEATRDAAAATLQDAEQHAQYLRDQAQAGAAVQALELAAADAQVELSLKALTGAQECLDAAVEVEREHVVNLVAYEVGDEWLPDQVDAATQELTDSVVAGVRALLDLLLDRDAASDAAGQRLVDAGLAPGQTLGRVSYRRVGVTEFSNGRYQPGMYNLVLDGVQLSPRRASGSTRFEEGPNLIFNTLVRALAEVGFKLGRKGGGIGIVRR